MLILNFKDRDGEQKESKRIFNIIIREESKDASN